MYICEVRVTKLSLQAISHPLAGRIWPMGRDLNAHAITEDWKPYEIWVLCQKAKNQFKCMVWSLYK